MSERGKFIGNVSSEGRDVNCAASVMITSDSGDPAMGWHPVTTDQSEASIVAQWPIRGKLVSVTTQGTPLVNISRQ